MAVPLELVVRHGASFEAQAKRAIKKVYAEGQEHRKNINPVNNPGFKMAPTVMGRVCESEEGSEKFKWKKMILL